MRQMPLGWLGWRAILLTMPLYAASLADVAADDRAAPDADLRCTLESGPTRSVARVLDAETLLLDDGSEVRLAGAIAPRARDAGDDSVFWQPERDAATALTELLTGQNVELAFSGRRSDRYGRLLAHAFIDRAGERIWVQGHMAANGHMRATAAANNAVSCLAEMLAHEAVARQTRLGLWANAAYQTRRASATYELLRYRNTYQLVAGRIAKVAATRATTYLNFGNDWRTDFTVAVPQSLMRRHAAWAEGLAALEGRDVIVRGWIERRNGPYIELRDPGELVIDTGAPRVAGTYAGRRGRAKPAAADSATEQPPATSITAPDARDL
jgi:endonuclease YncB( thermonuclease family)